MKTIMKHLLFGALTILLLTGFVSAAELSGKDRRSAKNRVLKKNQVLGGKFPSSGVSSPVGSNYDHPEINPSRGDSPDPPAPEKDPLPPNEEGLDPDQDKDEDEDDDRDVDNPIDKLRKD